MAISSRSLLNNIRWPSSSCMMIINIYKFNPSLNPSPSSPSSSLQLLHEPYNSWITRPRRRPNRCRDMVVHSGVDPAGAGPPPPPHSNWTSWVLGMVITVLLPFLRQKLGAFLLLTNRVENVVDQAEAVAEMIEKTAEAVEKAAEEISDDLPQGSGGNSKLTNAVDFVETLAKETAKDAHLAHRFIDQVQDVEDAVENIIHTEKKDIN